MRVALAVAVLVVFAVLIVSLSGRASRTAGSDHYAPLMYTAPVGSHTVVCQPLFGLPSDAAKIQMRVGGEGKPLPAINVQFLDAGHAVLAEGRLPAGQREGFVEMPLDRSGAGGTATEACVHVEVASGGVALAGEGVPPSALSARVNGQVVAARISLVYFRAGRESWWDLLPTLDERLGLGKASIFGSWLLPFSAVALFAVWAAAIRLLAKELR